MGSGQTPAQAILSAWGPRAMFEFSSTVEGEIRYVEIRDSKGALLDSLSTGIDDGSFEGPILYGRWDAYVAADDGTDQEDDEAFVTYYSPIFAYD